MHFFLQFFLIMDAKTMNDAVSFGEGGKGTVFKGAAETIGLFLLQFRVFGAHVKIKCLLLKESLFAYFADMID